MCISLSHVARPVARDRRIDNICIVLATKLRTDLRIKHISNTMQMVAQVMSVPRGMMNISTQIPVNSCTMFINVAIADVPVVSFHWL
jgi:hypothetical protein